MMPAVSARASVAALFLTLGLAACGSDVVVDGDGSGGSGSTTGTGGDISSTSGTPCDDYKDQLPLASVTFRVRNDWFQPIFVPGECDRVSYQLQPSSGPDGLGYGDFGGTCNQTCEDLQTQDQVFCGACAPTAYRIEPGGTLELTWSGEALESGMTMPDFCWFNPDGAQTCSRILAAKAQSYAISLTGYSECPDCMCDPATGLCSGYPTGLTANTNPTEFDFPAASSAGVDVNFDGCAFGCP
jgi:hypothetical protein